VGKETGFEEIEKEMLVNMRKRRDTLNQAIAQLEQSLQELPFESSLDYEEIQFIAEHDIVQFDQWEQERDRRK